jgi:hypothetical protein
VVEILGRGELEFYLDDQNLKFPSKAGAHPPFP